MLRSVIFDVNGTLTDPAAIGGVCGRREVGDHVLQQAVSTAMVDVVLNIPDHTFRDHLKAAIRVVMPEARADPSVLEQAVATAESLPARPGAAEALGTLRDAGLRLVALTNSGADGGQRTLEACGLARYIDLVLGVDAVGTFKPHPDVYSYALAQLDDEPSGITLIATHPWDLAGAAHAGIQTAWVRHGAPAWPTVFPEPDMQADTLEDLARDLLARSR